jgi:hypothetical protein
MLFKWLEDGAVIPAEEMIACATRILGVVVIGDLKYL